MDNSTKNKRDKTRKDSKAVISKSVRDYGNDPFVIKKANASQKFLEKHGFPPYPKK